QDLPAARRIREVPGIAAASREERTATGPRSRYCTATRTNTPGSGDKITTWPFRRSIRRGRNGNVTRVVHPDRRHGGECPPIDISTPNMEPHVYPRTSVLRNIRDPRTRA